MSITSSGNGTAPRGTTSKFTISRGSTDTSQPLPVNYTLGGTERVKTPLGELEALRFMRGSSEERTEVWLASKLDFLPVRILVLEKDGTRYEQLATKISPP